jgi:enoyl reductase-like protein
MLTKSQIRRKTMAMNPYEMRWDFLREAQQRLENKLEVDKEAWYQRKEMLENAGQVIEDPFPSYPTSDVIHATAEEMRAFVERSSNG